MARSKCKFTQSDVARAIKGARQAGIDIARCEIGADGKIVIIPVGKSQGVGDDVNPWDEVINANQKRPS
jgi:hypothetical protein